MGIETFPEIENFQHLPRQIIVKGGTSSFDAENGASLQGIVINNIGQPIRDLKIHAVVFNEKKIPVLNSTSSGEPSQIPQGGISTFSFQFKDYPKEITDYYLYTDWKFDDRT
jgi:hypothetical protein